MAPGAYATLNQEEVLSILRCYVETHGAYALTYTWLEENGHLPLYNTLKRFSLSLSEIATQWNMQDEVEAVRLLRKNKPKRWTDEAIHETFKNLQHGHIPSSAWLKENGFGGLLGILQNKNILLVDMRDKYSTQNAVGAA